MPAKTKSRPKQYQKKLTLYPMSFEEVIDKVLKYKPKKKKV